MKDANEFIRQKLREAREAAGLSQKELAEIVGSAQGTISDIERGRIRVNAADLVKYAAVLGQSVSYFLPGAGDSGLTRREQSLLAIFRQLDAAWQDNLLEFARQQLHFYKHVSSLDRVSDDELPAASRRVATQIVEDLEASASTPDDLEAAIADLDEDHKREIREQFELWRMDEEERKDGIERLAERLRKERGSRPDG